MSQSSPPPVLLWLRRDFRLHDHEALTAAVDSGRPVIPVFVLDPETEALGAAPKWRLEAAIRCFAETLAGKGLRLILRRGDALEVMRRLIGETGASAVFWSRLYDARDVARDNRIKAALKKDGAEARSFRGHLLFEPWKVRTGQDRPYSVYTPYWRNVAGGDVPRPLDVPGDIPGPADWPSSDALEDWRLGAAMHRGGGIVAKHAAIGEAAALGRLDVFSAHRLAGYGADRNRPDLDATSRLSAHLTWGEISPRSVWHATLNAEAAAKQGAESFRKELVWREFAWHLMWHSPDLATRNWRDGWDRFPWRGDSDAAERWRRGLTGVDVVDAGMRELYVTGTMHNRIRMIVASYLTKHLLTDWRIGRKWFEDTLIDWDPASNAMGWQWVAGSGPDAAPFFRVFNPDTQAAKFDPDGTYVRHYLGGDGAEEFLRAVPDGWGMSAADPRPDPVVSLAEGRMRALEAYKRL